MALAESNMMEVGTEAPIFSLIEPKTGNFFTLRPLPSQVATVIMFICNHCPYVKHINQALVNVANKYQPKGIQFIAINSNDVQHYPEDSPEQMIAVAKKEAYPFPYLYDESQTIAKAYHAACTPDFFVFDADLLCVYNGRFDESRPGKGIATGNDLITVLDCLIKGEKPDLPYKPSIGCSIKWKS